MSSRMNWKKSSNFTEQQDMDTFLKQVAHDLYTKTNGDFAHLAVVFPNKRASLFFNEYLAQEADRPIWSPAYVSISELFRQSSSLQVGDSIKLVCDLYRVFREATGSKETLDDFYFWGEMLISDFDDADKNLADSSRSGMYWEKYIPATNNC